MTVGVSVGLVVEKEKKLPSRIRKEGIKESEYIGYTPVVSVKQVFYSGSCGNERVSWFLDWKDRKGRIEVPWALSDRHP